MKAPSVAQNRAGQAGDWDCFGHTPEQICAGESKLRSQNEPWSFTAGNQSPVPELVAWAFCIEKYACTENCINFFQADSDSLSHSRLYIAHLPCPYKITARSAADRQAVLASCPLSNSCPISPQDIKRTWQGQRTLPIENLLSLK